MFSSSGRMVAGLPADTGLDDVCESLRINVFAFVTIVLVMVAPRVLISLAVGGVGGGGSFIACLLEGEGATGEAGEDVFA